MLITINPKSPLPIYRQITDEIRRRVAAGRVAPGERLPSVRELAARLLVNPNTVAKVYRDLERDGLLETRRGEGTYISNSAEALAESERRNLIAERLETVADEVRGYGVSDEDALDLFRQILNNRHPQ